MEESSTSRRAMFAIWQWPKWGWGVASPIALAAYLLSAAPVSYCIYRSGLDRNGIVINTARVVYFPVILLDSKSETYSRLFQWEMATIVHLFGNTEE